MKSFKEFKEIMAEEQIDELSKETLGSYIKKASGGLDGLGVHAYEGGNSQEKDKQKSKEHMITARKRNKGIQQAVDRLMKESEETYKDYDEDIRASHTQGKRHEDLAQASTNRVEARKHLSKAAGHYADRDEGIAEHHAHKATENMSNPEERESHHIASRNFYKSANEWRKHQVRHMRGMFEEHAHEVKQKAHDLLY